MVTLDNQNSSIEKLKTVDDSITSIKFIISYQNDEISKTENVISKLQCCLTKQQIALKMFNKEKDRLNKERQMFLKELNISENGNCDDENELLKDDYTGINELKRNNSFSDEQEVKLKRLKNSEQCGNLQKKQNLWTTLTNSAWDPDMHKVEINILNGCKINAITLSSGVIYIAGNNGLLLRHTSTVTHRYQADPNDHILFTEMVTINQQKSLVVASDMQVNVFVTTEFCSCYRIKLAYIRRIFSDGNIVYVTLASGVVKKLKKGFWELTEESISYGDDVRDYFHTHSGYPFAFVTMKDLSFRMVLSKKSLDEVELVKGVTGVKGLLHPRKEQFLCYSMDTVWFINSKPRVGDTLVFDNGIKLVAADSDRLVVVDYENCLFVYDLGREGLFRLELKRPIEGDVSAVAIYKNGIYVAVDGALFLLKHMY